jgi:predicted nucleic acid-binding protein
MPIAADATGLVDTSVAVALLVEGHAGHDTVSDAVRGRTLGLAGHAAFETFSVLSRLPAPARRTPAAIGRLLAWSFADTRFLDVGASRRLLDSLAAMGVSGGQVHDALVGAAAVHHDLPLITRDLRALDTYRAVGARVELIA